MGNGFNKYGELKHRIAHFHLKYEKLVNEVCRGLLILYNPTEVNHLSGQSGFTLKS